MANEGERARRADVAPVSQVERPPPVAAASWWRRWPDWAPYVAAAWSLAYGSLGLYWASGGPGFPFGENDPDAVFSNLGGLRAAETAPAIAILGLTGAVAAMLIATVARPLRGGPLRAALLAFAWTVAAFLLVIVPDARVLVAVAYAPVVLFGAPFGWPPGDYRSAIPWPVLNQFLCLAGGFAWAAALAYQRRAWAGAPPRWTRPEEAARWGRWATAVAVIIPLVYAATRLAWALGIPLGLTEEFFRQGQAEGLFAAGAALATVAIAGSALTLGLVQRWGEVFPRWLPGLGGRRVPLALAIVPASVVAVLVANAGLTFWRRTLIGDTSFDFFGGDWAALAPELLWPLWGLALGAATLAYYLRRRRNGGPS